MTDNLQSGIWSFPIPIHYGPGSIKQLGEIVRAGGMSRPLIVSDSGTADLPFLRVIMANLKANGLEPHLFSNFSPNPTDTECDLGGQAFREHNCDSVIAIGGGSSMDAGKGIGLIAHKNREHFWAFDTEAEPIPLEQAGPFAPLICVPTTSGTGAETEATGIVTNTTNHEKRCVYHPDYHPVAAILDAELTIGLPQNLTAWTGMDAIVHAIEAYLVPAYHPLCDGAALQALELMAPAIKRVYHDGTDLAARHAMIVGSCLAGIAFLKGLGLVHATSHMVGGLHDTQHGLTNAVVLPAALRHNHPAIEDKAAVMARICGAETHDFDGFYNWVLDLLAEFDIPHSLGELGVKVEEADQLALMMTHDGCLPTNPLPLDQAQCKEFVLAAIENTW